MASGAMEGFGAAPVPYDRMLDYWLRMASGAFALIGCVYLLLVLSPRRFAELIPRMVTFALVEGLVLLVHGLRLAQHPWPFYGDVSACLASGVGILISWPRAGVLLYTTAVEPSGRANRS